MSQLCAVRGLQVRGRMLVSAPSSGERSRGTRGGGEPGIASAQDAPVALRGLPRLADRRHGTLPPLGRNVKRFRGGLVFKAHRLVYHPTLGSRVIKKKEEEVRYPQFMTAHTMDRGLVARSGFGARGSSPFLFADRTSKIQSADLPSRVDINDQPGWSSSLQVCGKAQLPVGMKSDHLTILLRADHPTAFAEVFFFKSKPLARTD